MPRLLTLLPAQAGPQLFIIGRRYHHGRAGADLAIAAACALVVGIVLMADDWHDHRLWFKRQALIDAERALRDLGENGHPEDLATPGRW